MAPRPRCVREIAVPCCRGQNYDRPFDAKAARKDLRAYQKRGARGATARLLRLVQAASPQAPSLLDIGGGVGVIQPGFPIWLWYFCPFDQSSRLDCRGFLERNQATEGDTQWVNYKPRPFSSRSTDF